MRIEPDQLFCKLPELFHLIGKECRVTPFPAVAEEQENGLIRMKEIYKEQITKLRKALQEKDVNYNN